jgi:hypothetical protein
VAGPCLVRALSRLATFADAGLGERYLTRQHSDGRESRLLSMAAEAVGRSSATRGGMELRSHSER